MLFLGTEKYVNKNDYMSFLSENGGSSNVATYADTIMYYFDVVSETLDRFAQFFIAPLFTESATDIGKSNAVHSRSLADTAGQQAPVRLETPVK